jgi:hypothetical protein
LDEDEAVGKCLFESVLFNDFEEVTNQCYFSNIFHLNHRENDKCMAHWTILDIPKPEEAPM